MFRWGDEEHVRLKNVGGRAAAEISDAQIREAGLGVLQDGQRVLLQWPLARRVMAFFVASICWLVTTPSKAFRLPAIASNPNAADRTIRCLIEGPRGGWMLIT